MKSFQYILITLLLISVSFSMKPQKASAFSDVKENNPSFDSIQWAYVKGIISGNADGTFRPQAFLTEAQFAAMLTRYYAAFQTEAGRYKNLDHTVWSNSTYEALSRFHIPLLGYENPAYRNQPVSRGLLAQVFAYVNGETHELEGAVRYLLKVQISTGQSPQRANLLEQFGANNRLTRTQAVVFFHRLHAQKKIDLAKPLITKKLEARVGSKEAQLAKKLAAQMVDSRVKLKEVSKAEYIKGQQLPAKPTYIKNLLFVNKQYPLPKQFAPGENKTARAQFKKMATEARKSGIRLTAFSTYRSFDYQTSLYKRYVTRDGKKAADRYSARPGYSEHQTGLAFDIGETNQNKHWAATSFGQTPAGKWVAANAHRFGFIMRYPPGKEKVTGFMHESWHFRYVGNEVSKRIYKEGLTLEEYLGI
ncbi:D-alanyl-D-alanine carboxypeptidase family protein [Mammaliicoccus sciuri]